MYYNSINKIVQIHDKNKLFIYGDNEVIESILMKPRTR